MDGSLNYRHVEAPRHGAFKGIRIQAVRNGRREDIVPAAVGNDDQVGRVEVVLKRALKLGAVRDELLRTMQCRQISPVAMKMENIDLVLRDTNWGVNGSIEGYADGNGSNATFRQGQTD